MQRIANPSTPVRFRPQPQIYVNKYNINCLVIGGGVAGLAVARTLSAELKDIILIEKNNQIGQEISSRNSEVIHAGIYYKPGSLKSKLCLEGKELLYEYLSKRNIDYLKCGKFIVSTNKNDDDKLNTIFENANTCGLFDLEFDNEDIKKYPFISSRRNLFSPSSGIFDSHAFLASLHDEFEDNGGLVLLGNESVSVETESNNFSVHVKDKNNKEEFVIETKLLINCAGMEAVNIANSLYGHRKFKNQFIKGEYYTYNGREKLRHLIYPTPNSYSVGLHATIDLGRGIRFGPSAYNVDNIEYSVSEKEKDNFFNKVKAYWPSLKKENLTPSYSGIRPVLEGTDDFILDFKDFKDSLLVNVLGYASPGLTSSLALSKLVKSKLSDYQVLK